jgi:hypothetical protein
MIRLDLKEIGSEGMEWIHLTQEPSTSTEGREFPEKDSALCKYLDWQLSI